MEEGIIPIDITGGMKDDSSIKQTVETELLENVTLDIDGYPKKRNGFVQRTINPPVEDYEVYADGYKGATRGIVTDGDKDYVIYDNLIGTYNYNTEKIDFSEQVTHALAVEYIELLSTIGLNEFNNDNRPSPYSFSGFGFPNAEIHQNDVGYWISYGDMEYQTASLDKKSLLPIEGGKSLGVNDNLSIGASRMAVTTKGRVFNHVTLEIRDTTGQVITQAPVGIEVFEAPRFAGVDFGNAINKTQFTINVPATLTTDGVTYENLEKTVNNGFDVFTGYFDNTDYVYVVFTATYKIQGTSGLPSDFRNLLFCFRYEPDLPLLTNYDVCDSNGVGIIAIGVKGAFFTVLPRDIARGYVVSGCVDPVRDRVYINWFSYGQDGTIVTERSLSSIITISSTALGSTGRTEGMPLSANTIPYDNGVITIVTGNNSLTAPFNSFTSIFIWTNFFVNDDYTIDSGQLHYNLANTFAITNLIEYQGVPCFILAYVADGNYSQMLVEAINLKIMALTNVGDRPTNYLSGRRLWGGFQTLSRLEEYNGDLYYSPVIQNDVYGEAIGGIPGRRNSVLKLIRIYNQQLKRTTFNNDLVLNGSFAWNIVNNTPNMLGFAHPPLLDDVEHTTVTSGKIFYKLVYETFDNNGNIIRSQSSIQKEASETNFSNPATLYYIPYHFSNNNNHFVAVYRTKAGNPETFYFVKRHKLPPSFLAGGFGGPLALEQFIDNLNDADLGGELYIGQLAAVSELENTTPPVLSYVTNHNNRIYGISSQYKNKIFYSKQLIEGRGLEWNDTLSFLVDRDKEGQKTGLTALASTENYLICFKETSIFVVGGDGPNNVGIGETHTLPSLVSDAIGCIDPESVISVTMGVIFKSYKGWKLITKGLSVIDIDMGVSSRQDDKILRSLIHRKRNVIMWLTDNQEILCLDMNENENPIKWTVWKGSFLINSIDMSYGEDKLKILRNDGSIIDETDAYFDRVDNNTQYLRQKITTGWLRVGDIAEYQRVKRLFITGEWKSDHIFYVDVYYDFEEYSNETITLTPEGLYEVDTPPTNVNNGENTGVYEWDIHLARQKCSAIKFTISDGSLNGSIGEGFQLEGMALKVGKKIGLRKISERKKG